MEEPKSDKYMTCHFCESRVATYKKLETTPYTVITCALVCLIFWLWSICLLPFIIPLSKAVVTHCSRCENTLKTQQPFGLDSLKDEIVTLSCGKCAMVISRVYLIAAFAVVACGMLGYWFWTLPVETPRVYLTSSWPQYIRECGTEMLLKNPVTASTNFQRTYAGKTVSWEGYMMKVTEYESLWFRTEHAVVILVKMQPSESDIHADLIFSLNTDHFAANRDEISRLEKGHKFRFSGSFVTMGNEHSLHHLHGFSLEKLEGSIEIPTHVHSVNQRYHIHTGQPSSQVSLVTVKDVKPEAPDHSDVHHYNQNTNEVAKGHD